MIRGLRLVTGLVLFSFVTGHLMNLSFGLHSVEVLDAVRPWFRAPWTNPVGIVLLAGSLLVHASLGLLALYRRNTLHMTRRDMGQLLIGVAIPPLLMSHLFVVAVAPLTTDFSPDYATILTAFWVTDPMLGVLQVLALVAVWIHGCMGLFVWLRLRSWWPRLSGLVYPLAVVIPVLALLGMVEAGKQVVEQHTTASSAPEYGSGYGSDYGSGYGSGYDSGSERGAGYDADYAAGYGTESTTSKTQDREAVAESGRRILSTKVGLFLGYVLVIVAVLVARAYRLRGRKEVVRLAYVDGPEVTAAAGTTILELSRIGNVPHANLCGGRARCGTCRVRVLEGLERLPAPSDLEASTLKRVAAPEGVRLACQAVLPGGRVRVERLLPAYVDASAVHGKDAVAEEAGAEPVEVSR